LIFAALLREHGLPEPVAEFRFHPDRKWRADFCWEAQRLILECDGGIYTGGRHARGAGMEADFEKANEAACLGYRILRVVPRKLCTMATVDVVRRALA
jgi:very-short-patch-repair endonuclease